MFLGFWYNSTQAYSRNSINYLILNVISDIQEQTLAIKLQTNKKNGSQLQFYASDGTSKNFVQAYTNPGSLPFDGKYHVGWIQLDASTKLLRIAIDKKFQTLQTLNWVGSTFSVPLVTVPSGNTLRWYLCRGPLSPNYIGALAEVYGIFAQTVDITNNYVQNAFIDPNTGLPVRNADSGEIPVFDSNYNITKTLQAQLYLTGDIYSFPQNLPGWSAPTFDDLFTMAPGTNIDPVDSNPPSSFYTGAGALQVPTVGDPWGFKGKA